MKRKYIVFLIIFGLPLLDVFYACCNCSDDTIEKYYVNSGLSLINLDNSGKQPLEVNSGNINKNAYGIRLKVNREALSFNLKTQNQFLFTSSAYAFSCDCPPTVTYDPKYKVEYIKIVTLQNFSNEKPANSDVTEYFKTPKLYLDVNEIVGKLNDDFWDKLKEQESIDLLLMVPPSQVATEHQFKMIISFENKPNVELVTTVNLN